MPSPTRSVPLDRSGMDTISIDAATTNECVVVGASARSFAESATRAGWSVHAVDLFRDRDLIAATVQARAIARAAYPDGLPGAIARFPAGPCAYTGALENHPDVIAAIAAARPLAGCDPSAVKAVRDPSSLAAVVRDAGLFFPDTYSSPARVPSDGSFLVKPLASGGGRSIRTWRGDAAAVQSGMCWQRFVRGSAWSAAFLAEGGPTTLVGASRPAGYARECGCRRFAYSGSIDVPLPRLPETLHRTFEMAGRHLAAAFGLRGCFGVDVVVDGHGRVHVLEVNPRPTASLELVERACNWPVAGAHFAACGWGHAVGSPRPTDVVWSKAIVRARGEPRHLVAEMILEAAEAWTRADGLQAVADVPAAGSTPTAGSPLVTVFARGTSAGEARSLLRDRVLRIQRLATAPVSRQVGGLPGRRSPTERTASDTRPQSSPDRNP